MKQRSPPSGTSSSLLPSGRIPVGCNDLPPVDRMFKFHGVYKTGNFMDSFAIFFFRVDVWVVVEYCDVEIFRQVFQYVTAAGCTAAVEKQAWDLVIFLRLIYKFFQFFLIVSFIQQYYYILSASSQMLFIIF